MLKLNAKQTKENTRKWIKENFDASGYDREDLNEKDIEEQIAFIAYCCWNEKGFEVKKNRMTLQEMFFEWCQGLPSVIDTACYYYNGSAVDLLGQILEETEEEKAKFTELQAENCMTYLLYKEVKTHLYIQSKLN